MVADGRSLVRRSDGHWDRDPADAPRWSARDNFSNTTLETDLLEEVITPDVASAGSAALAGPDPDVSPCDAAL